MRVGALSAVDELLDLLHEDDRDLLWIVVRVVRDRLAESDDDGNVALEVLRASLSEDALAAPNRARYIVFSCSTPSMSM